MIFKQIFGLWPNSTGITDFLFSFGRTDGNHILD